MHHGGAGTTACALRSGVPSIVTPIFVDQFDYAYLVQQLGVGVGFKKQFQKIAAGELGDAIKKCVTSVEFVAKASQLGKVLQSHDGAGEVVHQVQEFWKEFVVTGRFRKDVEDHVKRKEAANTGSCFKRPGKLCCGGV